MFFETVAINKRASEMKINPIPPSPNEKGDIGQHSTGEW
jgi:hypothetical protein